MKCILEQKQGFVKLTNKWSEYHTFPKGYNPTVDVYQPFQKGQLLQGASSFPFKERKSENG